MTETEAECLERRKGKLGWFCWSSCVRNAVTGVRGAETGLSLPVPVHGEPGSPEGQDGAQSRHSPLLLLSGKFLIAPVGVLGVHRERGAPSQGRTASVTQTQLQASSGAGSALE